MKTKINKKHKIKVITLGCSKNIVDSEKISYQVKAANFQINPDPASDDADIVIINTCGFIEDAKQESIDTILNYVNAKAEGKIKKLFVTGCLSERYKKDLQVSIPEVDEYFGVHDLKSLMQALNIDYKSELHGQRLLSTPKHYAYLKISEGCDRTCSFCAIPMIRGRHISKSIDDLVKESFSLAKNGVKELLVIAQDTTYYGIDIYKKQKIAELLGKLSEIEEIEWIRLHYAYPTGFPGELIDLIASNHKMCKYLDIPFQHVNDRILKSMRRSHTKKDIIRLVYLSRRKIRDLAIRTAFIVGYPGETDKEFGELYDFIKEVKFERLGVFKYSHEEGTSAYKLKDSIPARIKEERYNEIMKLQRDISLEHNQKMLHKEIKVIIDRKESGYWIGRSMFDSPEIDNEVVLSNKKNKNLTGKIVSVKITDFENYDLFGKII